MIRSFAELNAFFGHKSNNFINIIRKTFDTSTMRLRILVIGAGRIYDPHFSNDRFYLEELSRQADTNFIVLKADTNPEEVERQLDILFNKYKFDLIYKYYNKKIDTSRIRPLSNYGVPVFYASGDCHTRLLHDNYRKKIEYHGVKNIIVNNRSTIPHFKDAFKSDLNFIWVPWAFNPNIHRDYGYRKKWDVTIPAGNFEIPIRGRVRNFLFESDYKYNDKFFTARRGTISPKHLAKIVNKCEIGVSTCQNDKLQMHNGKFIGMTFNKYFEIPMCNALHIGQRSADAELLGFEDGVNVVMFDTFEEFKEKLNYYLKHKDEMSQIVANSVEFVKNNHSYKHRVSKFLADAKEIIG